MHTDIANNRTVNQFICEISVKLSIKPDTLIVAEININKVNATTDFWGACGIEWVIICRKNVAWTFLRRDFNALA